MDPTPYRAFISELAALSGDFIRPYYGSTQLKVDTKADESPVTEADRGAEELMRTAIGKKFPGHGIIGEEFGPQNPKAEFVWVLDPIDGTKSFVAGVPLWGTLIALLHQGQPILGCIHQPILKELMLGDGKTTALNGKPVHCTATQRLADATLLTSCPMNLGKKLGAEASVEFLSKAKVTRTWGDCYGYYLLASGRADVMCDPYMNLWDIAALVPIVRGAGGVVTDWSGGPPFPAEATIAAATPGLHAEVLAALK